MKKAIAVVLLLSLVFAINGCVQSEYIELGSFIERFNKADDSINVDFTLFYVLSQNSSDTVLNCSIEQNSDKVLLRLEQNENNKITQCRVVLIKCDENANELSISQSEADLFFSVCIQTIAAFTNFDLEKSTQMAKDLSADKKETFEANSEQTLQNGSFYFIMLTDTLCSQFIIQNRWLCEIETTLKPESNSIYDSETTLRTETVPHT